MPIYEYRCSSCGFQKEYLQKVTDPLRSSCPECGRESFQKMLTAAGFQLKGSGWYASDFKGNGAPPAKEKSESAKSDAPGTTAESAKRDAPAKTAESAKTEAPARGAGGGAACSVTESGS